MSQHAFPTSLFLLLAPLVTWMLARDLHRRIATTRYRAVSEADHPGQYWVLTAVNMAVVMVCWYQVAAIIAGWATGLR